MTNLKLTLDHLPFTSIEKLVDCLHWARISGKRIFILGNGGSAATATHLACDLGKNTVTAHLPRFKVVALTDNLSAITAIGNDLGYDNIFAEQLENLVEEGDVVVAISASGNSPNVLKAIQLAHTHNAFTVGWSGYSGGKLSAVVDLPIVIPCDSIEQIEDVHLIIAHMVTVAVRQMGMDYGVGFRKAHVLPMRERVGLHAHH
jgi:D-sedoheptulose 7-phosphate isomerase